MKSLLLSFLTCFAVTAVFAYDPLKLPEAVLTTPLDLTVQDAKRDRALPIRVYLPATTQAAPVVLFSHGLGGSCQNNPYLGKHWSARGYAVVFVQHPGSDESVWKGQGPARIPMAMKQAANVQNFILRAADIPAVLDQLTRWNADEAHSLRGKLDLARVGMSGHSFGAVTTQAVSGQTMPIGSSLTDPRIKAAVMMSPSVPAAGNTERAFGSVTMPWLLMTGTKDVARIGAMTIGGDLDSRLGVYPALPPGDKYELVLHSAEHGAFGERSLPGEGNQRNPNHHRVILALSTAFWDAFLKGDAEAKAWLNGEGPHSVMEKDDKWQRK
ncbi:MAG: alpha/beta hydrolase family protein [Prosthecobacter sp.]|uniref:alpha/beta hydrolase family protein n=1 Tax=Prosthecobacter sp. TaxID=1965333 RepID=UPI0039000BD4